MRTTADESFELVDRIASLIGVRETLAVGPGSRVALGDGRGAVRVRAGRIRWTEKASRRDDADRGVESRQKRCVRSRAGDSQKIASMDVRGAYTGGASRASGALHA
jgi:hypothetical protein